MIGSRRAGRVGALPLIALTFVVAACGGATTSGAPSGSSGTAASSAPGSAATPTPAASSGAASTEPSAAAFPSFDVGQLAKGLENVDSYRVSVTVGGEEQYKGVVVTKPELARDLTIGGDTRVVVIGSDAWMAQGNEPLKSVPSTLATSLFAAFDPTILVGAFSGPGWAQSSLDMGSEQKNGISSKHYHIDSSTLVSGFAGVPAGASIDVWIADEGYLVAWESKGFATGGDTSIQVTGVDDPANKIERPS